MSDLLKAGALLFNFWMLRYFDYSRVYHFVRGESTIRLFVMYNMLEIFEKLCTSFGQDIQDAALYSATEPAWKEAKSFSAQTKLFGRAAMYYVIYLIYLCMYCKDVTCVIVVHSILQLLRIVSLNVALNSESETLLTLLISNNFAEIKAHIFRKFTYENVFQITCSGMQKMAFTFLDVIERLQLVVYIAAIIGENSAHHSLRSNALILLGVTFGTEIAVDWMKHAFIIKSNGFKSQMYRVYRDRLCEDLREPVSEDVTFFAVLKDFLELFGQDEYCLQACWFCTTTPRFHPVACADTFHARALEF